MPVFAAASLKRVEPLPGGGNHDGNRRGGVLRSADRRGCRRDDQVDARGNEFLGQRRKAREVSIDTGLDESDVAGFEVAELCELGLESVPLMRVGGVGHEEADFPNATRLGGRAFQAACERRGEDKDDSAAVHSITRSARSSITWGIAAELAHAGIEARVGRQLAKHGLRSHRDDADGRRFGGQSRPREGGEGEGGEQFQSALHSITSSARTRTSCGILSPSSAAVLRLITVTKRSACSTGRSAGFAPRRILSTYVAVRRNPSLRSDP